MFSNFIPINDNVLIELVEKEQKTQGGILIPDEAQEDNQVAVVIHAGNSKQLISGDRVYYKKYIGHPLNDTLLVLREEEILGKM